MRRAERARRADVNFAGHLPLSAEVAWPVLPRLVGSRTGHRGSQLQAIEEIGWRKGRLRETVGVHLAGWTPVTMHSTNALKRHKHTAPLSCRARLIGRSVVCCRRATPPPALLASLCLQAGTARLGKVIEHPFFASRGESRVRAQCGASPWKLGQLLSTPFGMRATLARYLRWLARKAAMAS